MTGVGILAKYHSLMPECFGPYSIDTEIDVRKMCTKVGVGIGYFSRKRSMNTKSRELLRELLDELYQFNIKTQGGKVAMSYGDTGGSITELIITCKTPPGGTVNITKDDAVYLVGAYTVDNKPTFTKRIFGQAMADRDQNNVAIAVKVRGVCVFRYTGGDPLIGRGVVNGRTPGAVHGIYWSGGDGIGQILKADENNHTVHVLL